MRDTGANVAEILREIEGSLSLPDPRPVPEREAASQTDLSARLKRFFVEEAPALPAEERQRRLDQLVREHARKWFGSRLE